MNSKVAILLPYFGKLPVYSNLFFESVKSKSFDIFIITDIEQPIFARGPNIYWTPIGFSNLKQNFSNLLGVNVALENPYKLCDFKPAYGFLFEKMIKEYEFWGVIDMDTILGNFESLFKLERLQEIDFYSGIKEYVSGSFFLVRNNEYCNTLFKKSKDWINVFTAPSYKNFDECCGHFFEQLKAGKSIFELNTPYKSYTEVILTERNNGLKSLFTDEILEMRGLIPAYIRPDAILYKGNNFLLLHFIYLKRNNLFNVNLNYKMGPNFYINSLGIFGRNPTKIKMIFSRNLLRGIADKVDRRFKKLGFFN